MRELIDFQRQNKDKFTADLTKMINKFNEDTGLYISNIYVKNQEEFYINEGTKNIFTGLEVTVEL